MSPELSRFPVRIYWEDTDAGGIVYHANYLKFMERARTDLLHRLNVSQNAELGSDGGVLFVVASANLRYRRAARLDDDLTVATRIKTLRRASIVFEQIIRRGDDVITEGEVRVGVVSAATLLPTPLPGPLYARITSLLAAESSESAK